MVDPRLDEIIDGVEAIKTEAESKQDKLVSGENIKTVNNQSLLGSGNLDIQGGGTVTVDDAMSDSSTNPVQNKVVKGYIDGRADAINIALGALGTELETDYDELNDEIDVIESKIPAQASSENQLADKNFVNSSVATATATFRGTFTSLSSLQEAEGDRNDYAFYVHTDAAGNTLYDRYKYVGLPDTRVPEGYTERLYLKKTRNSSPYFITNFKIQSTDKIEIKYYGGGYAAQIGCLIGAADANNNYFSFEKGLNAIQFYLYNKNPNEFSSYITIPKNYNTQFILEINDGKVYTKDINGDNTQLVGNFTLNGVDADLFIFAFNNNGQVANRYLEELNIGDITVYGGGNTEKRLELVPCTRNSDSVNGYYDAVSKAFISPTDGVFTAQSLSTDKWAYEYSLNNSSFTADQWAAINSGLAQNVTSTGFDATATQVLKNVNGVIQWVTE